LYEVVAHPITKIMCHISRELILFPLYNVCYKDLLYRSNRTLTQGASTCKIREKRGGGGETALFHDKQLLRRPASASTGNSLAEQGRRMYSMFLCF
jgi:hypothetical protein